MTQYIKAYKNGIHLINLDYVKEIYTNSTVVNNECFKELVFIDNSDNVILRFQGATPEFINECLSKIERFITEQKDVIFYLY